MRAEGLHCFTRDERFFAIDPSTCFCFECDEISWDILQLYPHTSVNRIYHLLSAKHDPKELEEVIGELEWLRSSKSILKNQSPEEQQKALMDVSRDLERVSLIFPEANETSQDWERVSTNAVALLTGRSGAAQELELACVMAAQDFDEERVLSVALKAFDAAGIVGKSLRVIVEFLGVVPTDSSSALRAHSLDVIVIASSEEDLRSVFSSFVPVKFQLGKYSKVKSSLPEAVELRVRLTPLNPTFADALATLVESGCGFVEVDFDAAFASEASLNPDSMLDGVVESVGRYARALEARRYHRIDPFASLFWRIYNGTPVSRMDRSGSQALAVYHDGSIYPSRHVPFEKEHRLGSVLEEGLNQERVGTFDDVGSITTPQCRQCWARNLCGGGCAAVHLRLSGNFRTPNEQWCDWQRGWISAAVASFSALSAGNVNFGSMYQQLTPSAKPSLLTLARARFRFQLGMRPLEEADAEWLCEWENWNRSSYFLLNERSVFLGNQYDREMDATHPRANAVEVVLVPKDGKPMGLLRMTQEAVTGGASGQVYFRDERDYEKGGVRKSLKELLKEMAAQQSSRFLIARAAEWEEGLQAFLEGVGFENVGCEREAIYTAGTYGDVQVYRIDLESL